MNFPESPIAPPNRTALFLLTRVSECPNLGAGASLPTELFTY